MRISDWSSDVCSSDLPCRHRHRRNPATATTAATSSAAITAAATARAIAGSPGCRRSSTDSARLARRIAPPWRPAIRKPGSERVMIHELRVYRCVPGRLPALLKRFETVTLKLWERHGIRQAGFWTVLVGESNQDLYYLLAWDSLAEREAKWNAFAADPEWLEKRSEEHTSELQSL